MRRMITGVKKQILVSSHGFMVLIFDALPTLFLRIYLVGRLQFLEPLAGGVVTFFYQLTNPLPR